MIPPVRSITVRRPVAVSTNTSANPLARSSGSFHDPYTGTPPCNVSAASAWMRTPGITPWDGTA